MSAAEETAWCDAYTFTCVDPSCASGFTAYVIAGEIARCPVCKIPVRLLDAEGHYDAADSTEAPKGATASRRITDAERDAGVYPPTLAADGDSGCTQ